MFLGLKIGVAVERALGPTEECLSYSSSYWVDYENHGLEEPMNWEAEDP